MSVADTYFLNVSSEKIPPYAVMQVVVNPTQWPEIDKYEYNAGIRGELAKIYSLGNMFKIRGQQVICCTKPMRASQIMQDAATLAFNGPQEVQPGAVGVCQRGQFRYVTCGGGNSIGSALFVKADEWYLRTSGWRDGPFRPIESNDQVFTYKGNKRSLISVQVNTRMDPLPTPMIQGSYSMIGVGEFPVEGLFSPRLNVMFRNEFHSVESRMGFVDQVYFTGGRTLKFEMPGTYEVMFSGKMEVDASITPSELTVVPVKLDLAWRDSSGVDDLDKLDKNTTFFLRKWIREDDVIRVMSASEIATAGADTRWETASFVFGRKLSIENGGREMYFSQDGSPYVRVPKGDAYVRGFNDAIMPDLIFSSVANFAFAAQRDAAFDLTIVGWSPFRSGSATVVLHKPDFN